MKKKKPEKTSISRCVKCEQLCCKYITVKIPAPRTIRDFDGLLWQLAHENIQAFKDSMGWHLLIYNPCVHLKGNGKCAIYEKRPLTCREHSDEECEYDSPISKTSVRFFDSFESLNRFCRKKFKTWDRRF